MQSEKTIEIDDVFSRNVDARAHRVIRALAVGYDDIESVGGATLKNDDQALGLSARIDRAERGAGQDA